MDKHWRYVAEESHVKNKVYALRWEVYVTDKEDLIRENFRCLLHTQNGGTLFRLV